MTRVDNTEHRQRGRRDGTRPAAAATRRVSRGELGIREIVLYEAIGTGLLILLGCGVVANVALAKTKGFNGGFLLVNFGWGIGVFAGV